MGAGAPHKGAVAVCSELVRELVKELVRASIALLQALWRGVRQDSG